MLGFLLIMQILLMLPDIKKSSIALEFYATVDLESAKWKIQTPRQKQKQRQRQRRCIKSNINQCLGKGKRKTKEHKVYAV